MNPPKYLLHQADEGWYKTDKTYFSKNVNSKDQVKAGFIYYIKISNDNKPLIFTSNGELLKVFLKPKSIIKHFQKLDKLPDNFGSCKFYEKAYREYFNEKYTRQEQFEKRKLKREEQNGKQKEEQ